MSRYLTCALVLLDAACGRDEIDFESLPDGTPTTPVMGNLVDGQSVPASSIVSNQYASEGVRFESDGGGVFLWDTTSIANSGTAPSGTRIACPAGSGRTADFDALVIAWISRRICNFWITATANASTVTMTAHHPDGRAAVASSAGVTADPAHGGKKFRVNLCGMQWVELSGTNYCFDDVILAE